VASECGGGWRSSEPQSLWAVGTFDLEGDRKPLEARNLITAVGDAEVAVVRGRGPQNAV
jgi:hypothetical protein